MALTRDFKATVKARAENDPEFRAALLEEAVDAFVQGDVDAGKIMLRDYVNATVGFEPLAKAVKKEPKSLMRMLSASGNPTTKNLFQVISHLRKKAGVNLKVVSVEASRKKRELVHYENSGSSSRAPLNASIARDSPFSV